MSGKEVAVAVRKELRQFKGVKFSVTSDYDQVTIKWENGPTSKAIMELCSKYELGQFNGMIDLYEYSNRRGDIPQCKYIFTNRRYSAEVINSAIADVCKKYRIEGAFSAEDYTRGRLRNVPTMSNSDHYWDLQETVGRALAEAANN